jgi:hypothetical protein
VTHPALAACDHIPVDDFNTALVLLCKSLGLDVVMSASLGTAGAAQSFTRQLMEKIQQARGLPPTNVRRVLLHPARGLPAWRGLSEPPDSLPCWPAGCADGPQPGGQGDQVPLHHLRAADGGERQEVAAVRQ